MPDNLEPHLRALGIAPASESDSIPPVDLRTVPRDKWADYEAVALQLPNDITGYLTGRDFAAEPLTSTEIESIEDRLTAFYELAPRYQATFAAGAFRLQAGR